MHAHCFVVAKYCCVSVSVKLANISPTLITSITRLFALVRKMLLNDNNDKTMHTFKRCRLQRKGVYRATEMAAPEAWQEGH